MTTALICGVSGQTGAYLAHALLSQGVLVVGTSRDHSEANLWRLKRLQVFENIELVSLSLHDPVAIRRVMTKYQPDEVYYLAGPSSVAGSFREPLVSLDQIFQPIVTFLEVLRESGSPTRFFNAASTDCFGNQPEIRLDETSAFQPLSPYAVAKSAAYWAVKNYRESFGVKCSNGILTNHESPLRGGDFVTQKIIRGLRDIQQNKVKTLPLGSTKISRDWLWAGDVAHALTLINQAPDPDDYVIASGKSSTLQDFIELACQKLDLNPGAVITEDKSLFRPSDIQTISLNPHKANTTMGWVAEYSLDDIVTALIDDTVGPRISAQKLP
jgi:GDPmannose 4,6-dehydratase